MDRKKKKEYIYSSVELSKFYGMSVKGLSFYEKHGLIDSVRLGSGNVRRYDLNECYRLASVRMLRNCGLSIEHIAQILEAKHDDEFTSSVNVQLKKLRKQIQLQAMQLDLLENMFQQIDTVKSLDTVPCEIVNADGFYRLFLRKFNDSHHSTSSQTSEFRKWNSVMPIANGSMKYPIAKLLDKAADINTEIGMIVSAQDFDHLGLSVSERVEFIPSGRFVHTIIFGSQKDLNSLDRLQPALNYIRDHGLQLHGDAFTKLIYPCNIAEEVIRYDEVWLPIE